MDDLLSRPVPLATDVPHVDLRPSELLKRGWELVKPHYVNLLAILLGWMVLEGLVGRSRLGGVISILLSAVLHSGLVYFLLRAYRGEQPGFMDLVVPIQRKPAEVLVVSILSTVLIVIGTILLVVPGVYASVVLILSMPLTVVTVASPFEALRLSREIVHRQLGDWVLLLVVLFLMNLVAMIPFGLGLLVSVPVTLGAMTLALAPILGVEPASGGRAVVVMPSAGPSADSAPLG